MIPPTPSVARALRAEQDAEDDRNRLERLVRKGGVLVLDTPGEPIPAVLLSDEPPVDEDARELADAYERGIKEGFARAIRLGAAHLREIGEEKADSVVIAAGDWLEEWGQANALELTKQGAVSS